MEQQQVLELTRSFPLRSAHPGEIIIEEEGDSPELLILESGTVEVRRGGQLVAVIDEPGATLGEISMLLESPSTADVVARNEVQLRVVADPDALFNEHPELAQFLARQLAARLARVTGYLADLREEVGDPDGHMGLVPQIVSDLLTWRRLTAEAAEAGATADAIDQGPAATEHSSEAETA